MGENDRDVAVHAATSSADQSGNRDSRVLEAYRKGDPLRTIALEKGTTVEAICSTIVGGFAEEAELARSRSVRRRSRRTIEEIWANEEMVSLLDDAMIDPADIPKILAALGIEIDVETAVELLDGLRTPWTRPEDEEDLPPRRLGDKLSLLYIAGKHHGIEPDYQLALGKMSLATVSGLRELLHPNVPYRRLAEILAVIENAALAIRAKKITTLAYSDYDKAFQEISRQLGSIAKNRTDPWPVPAGTLVHRYGHGFWEVALNTAGLRLQSAEARFAEYDYLQALDDFTEECITANFPMDIGNYDRFVIAQAAMRSDCPSAAEVVRHYGSWEAALDTILPPEPDVELIDDVQSQDRDIAPREAVDDEWHEAGTLISDLLGRMPWNSFLRVEYHADGEMRTSPYAQATPSADGVWCEIVSEQYLPAVEWPIDHGFLQENGWSAPDEEVPNWLKMRVPQGDAGHEIVKGLRHGRQCRDPQKLRWSTGEFPAGPSPDGGVTLDDALAGVVQTLRNAS